MTRPADIHRSGPAFRIGLALTLLGLLSGCGGLTTFHRVVHPNPTAQVNLVTATGCKGAQDSGGPFCGVQVLTNCPEQWTLEDLKGKPPVVGYQRVYDPGTQPLPCWKWASSDLTPRHPSADYRLMADGQIPVETGTVDAAWICLVLGGIHGPALERTIEELRRVMRPGGLVFLVENTSEAAGDSFWAFRSVADYQKLCLPIALEHVHDYTNLGERISVMAGRTAVPVLDRAPDP